MVRGRSFVAAAVWAAWAASLAPPAAAVIHPNVSVSIVAPDAVPGTHGLIRGWGRWRRNAAGSVVEASSLQLSATSQLRATSELAGTRAVVWASAPPGTSCQLEVVAFFGSWPRFFRVGGLDALVRESSDSDSSRLSRHRHLASLALFFGTVRITARVWCFGAGPWAPVAAPPPAGGASDAEIPAPPELRGRVGAGLWSIAAQTTRLIDVIPAPDLPPQAPATAAAAGFVPPAGPAASAAADWSALAGFQPAHTAAARGFAKRHRTAILEAAIRPVAASPPGLRSPRRAALAPAGDPEWGRWSARGEAEPRLCILTQLNSLDGMVTALAGLVAELSAAAAANAAASGAERNATMGRGSTSAPSAGSSPAAGHGAGRAGRGERAVPPPPPPAARRVRVVSISEGPGDASRAAASSGSARAPTARGASAGGGSSGAAAAGQGDASAVRSLFHAAGADVQDSWTNVPESLAGLAGSHAGGRQAGSSFLGVPASGLAELGAALPAHMSGVAPLVGEWLAARERMEPRGCHGSPHAGQSTTTRSASADQDPGEESWEGLASSRHRGRVLTNADTDGVASLSADQLVEVLAAGLCRTNGTARGGRTRLQICSSAARGDSAPLRAYVGWLVRGVAGVVASLRGCGVVVGSLHGGIQDLVGPALAAAAGAQAVVLQAASLHAGMQAEAAAGAASVITAPSTFARDVLAVELVAGGAAVCRAGRTAVGWAGLSAGQLAAHAVPLDVLGNQEAGRMSSDGLLPARWALFPSQGPQERAREASAKPASWRGSERFGWCSPGGQVDGAVPVVAVPLGAPRLKPLRRADDTGVNASRSGEAKQESAEAPEGRPPSLAAARAPWSSRPPPRHAPNTECVSLAFVGRLSPEKAPGLALRLAAAVADALATAPHEQCAVGIDFFGDGALMSGLRSLAASLQRRSRYDSDGNARLRVSFRGQMAGDEMWAELSRARTVLLFPGLPHFETFGLATVEAMRAEVPVASWGGAGTSDVLAEGLTAMLLPHPDQLGAAARLLADQLTKHRERVDRLVASAKLLADNQHSAEAAAARQLRLFACLAQCPGLARAVDSVAQRLGVGLAGSAWPSAERRGSDEADHLACSRRCAAALK